MLIILSSAVHYTSIKIEPRGCKRSASPIASPKKQRLRLETKQVSKSEKKDYVLKVKDLFKVCYFIVYWHMIKISYFLE
jgi:hypothetical protein